MIQRRTKFNPYLLLILSFLGLVFLGSFLLSMPWAFKDNPSHEWCHVGNYLDAFFTSLSAMSLTGVTTYPDGLVNTLSMGGQIVVIILVQIGGLGIVTILTFLFTLFRRRLQFKNRLILSQAIAFNNFSEIVKYVRRLIAISAICETIGFAMGIPVFLQLFPDDVFKALCYSLFHSVSAFNNAGFDLFNSTSSVTDGLMTAYGSLIDTSNWLYYYFTAYIMVLSLLGGISFLVIIDIVIGHKPPRLWSAFTKIALVTTAGMIILGTGGLFLTDGLKGSGSMTIYQAFFQIVNCRTAGFTIYPQNDISLPGKIICAITMFIGGSPLSTAGGIKVTTFFIIIVSIISYFSGKRLSPFKRAFSDNVIAKSMSLVFVVFVVLFAAISLVSVFGITEVDGYTLNPNIENNLVEAYIFEVFSCFSNVGFITGLTPYLSIGAKIVLCFLMLLGHLGPMTFFQLFQNNLDKKANVHYSFVEEDFLIG